MATADRDVEKSDAFSSELVGHKTLWLNITRKKTPKKQQLT